MTDSHAMPTSYEDELVQWFERMAEAASTLTSRQRQELKNWERSRAVEGTPAATSDWPGWQALPDRAAPTLFRGRVSPGADTPAR